jgi:hypothetical protein
MDYDHKKKINEKICLVTDKQIFYDILNIIKDDLNDKNEKKYTKNNNGIFFDLNKISNENLLKIEQLLNKYSLNISDSETNITKNINIQL